MLNSEGVINGLKRLRQQCYVNQTVFVFDEGDGWSFGPLSAFRGERTLAVFWPYKRHNRHNSNPFSIFHSFTSTCILSANYNRKSSPELAVLSTGIKLGKVPFLPGRSKMPSVTQPEISLLYLARVVWRHKGKMLACFVGVVGLATVAALFWPKTFRSEGKLLVRLGRENMAIDPTATVGATPMLTIQPSRENEINSIIEIMHSRVLIEKVVDVIGPDVLMESDASPTLPPADGSTSDSALVRAAAIRMLSKSLNVEAARKSDVVLISYDAGSPVLAQNVVSRMIEYFLEEHVRLNRTPGCAGVSGEANRRNSPASTRKGNRSAQTSR